MNILDINKKCVGCGACVDACPKDALALQHNIDGFYVPAIINTSCIDCNRCVKVCPVIDTPKRVRSSVYYYGWAKDEEIRANSTSGGAFSVLANSVLGHNGVVFGAKYSDDKKSVLMASTEECNLEDLRKSKYCQSTPCGLYKKIANALKEGRQVMLTGTPCQITAAKKCFGENENLLLVAFICGGVIPDTALKEYIEWIENKYKSKVKYLNIRDKGKGWSVMRIKVGFENGKVYSRHYQLDYYYYYYTPNLKNEQCMTCSFTNHDCVDISIADFWGFRREKLEHDDKGLSLICAHTKKGREALDEIKNEMILFDLEEQQVSYAFQEKAHSEKAFVKRREFLEQVRNSSFIEAAKKNHFRGGMGAVCLRAVIRKIFKKK